jgi:Uri superfamily endonuclease
LNNELNSGAYQLYINISRKVKIKIGSLGEFKFEQGIYVYTGSAMKNLRQRVARHQRLASDKDKSKLRWHIDYLLTNKFVHLEEIKLFPSTQKEECEINQVLLNQGKATIPIAKFGSSDCRNCKSHLVYIL